MKVDRERCRKVEYFTIPYSNNSQILLRMVGSSLLPPTYLRKMQNLRGRLAKGQQNRGEVGLVKLDKESC